MAVRRSFQVLLACAAAVALGAHGVAALPSATTVRSSATDTSLTIKAPTEVQSGSSATLRGTLRTRKGRPVPRVTVVVQARQPGGPWTTAERTRTTRRGAWRVSTTALTRTTEFRARSKRTTRWASDTSAVRRVRVAGSTIPEPTPTPTPTPVPTPTPTSTRRRRPPGDHDRAGRCRRGPALRRDAHGNGRTTSPLLVRRRRRAPRRSVPRAPEGSSPEPRPRRGERSSPSACATRWTSRVPASCPCRCSTHRSRS